MNSRSTQYAKVMLWIRGLMLLISIGCTTQVSAQVFSVKLTPGQQRKLDKAKSGHQQMKRYYKFHRKDSARLRKTLDKRHQHELDSVVRVEKKQGKMIRRLTRKGFPIPEKYLPRDTVPERFKHWYSLTQDTTLSDSARSYAKQKAKEHAVEIARRAPGYSYLQSQQVMFGDSVKWGDFKKHIPGADTLKDLFEDPAGVFAFAEKQDKLKEVGFIKSALRGLPGRSPQLDELNAMKDKLAALPEQKPTVETAKEQAKNKLVQKASQYMDSNPGVMQSAQTRTRKLLSKYRMFSNSENLKDAKKHSSMEGKTIFERLVIGGKFNIVSIKPVSLEFAPELGFRFSSRLSAGLGISYRYTFGDTIRHAWYVSPKNTSLMLFASYDVTKGIYLWAEWARSGIVTKSEEQSSRKWVDNYFLGAGRKFLVHPKLYITATALYNLNSDRKNASYINRFQIRMGFQLSELATRKKKMYYNPNR